MIIVAFCVSPPVGIILMIIKLAENGTGTRNRNTPRYYNPPPNNRNYTGNYPGWTNSQPNPNAYNPQNNQQNRQYPNYRPPQNQQGQGYQQPMTPNNQRAPAPPPPPRRQTVQNPQPGWAGYQYRPTQGLSKAQRDMLTSTGSGLRLSGVILLAIALFVSAIITVSSIGSGDFFSGIAASSITALSIGAPGAVLFGFGKSQQRNSEKFTMYYNIVGNQKEVDLDRVASAVGTTYDKACKDIINMISRGFFPGAYIDASTRSLICPSGYLDRDGRMAVQKKDEGPLAEGQFREVQRIREVNERIKDEFVTERIYILEELTHKILTFVKDNPEKKGNIRQFEDHYLPKTMKILESYAVFEKQGIKGQNIQEAMKNVRETMDTLVSGFEKQLDMLFDDEAMNVSADLNVLENMMGLGGLNDDDPFNLKLVGDDFT